MAVVHVIDRVWQGHGRGLTALSVARAQHAAGWDVRLLVSGVHSPRLLPSRPVPEPLLGDLSADVYRDVAALGRVARGLARLTTTADTLICHEGIDLAAACRLGDRAVVAAVHSDPEYCLGYLPRADLEVVRRRTRHWLAWGTSVARRLATAFGIEPELITVSGQSIEPEEAQPARLVGTPAVVTVGRVHPVKNHALLLEALAVLAQALPEVHWHMVGGCEDPAYLRGLQNRADRLRVSGRVTWHGYRDDIPAVLRGSGVAVLASLSEGVPRAIQEAMLLAVPTVMPQALASDLSCAGLPVVYRRQEPGALAEAVLTACRVDPSTVATAAACVAERWGWSSVLSDWRTALGTGVV